MPLANGDGSRHFWSVRNIRECCALESDKLTIPLHCFFLFFFFCNYMTDRRIRNDYPLTYAHRCKPSAHFWSNWIPLRSICTCVIFISIRIWTPISLVIHIHNSTTTLPVLPSPRSTKSFLFLLYMLDSLLLFWFVTEFITFVLDNLSFFLSFLYSSYNGMQKFKTTTHDIYGKKKYNVCCEPYYCISHNIHVTVLLQIKIATIVANTGPELCKWKQKPQYNTHIYVEPRTRRPRTQ